MWCFVLSYLRVREISLMNLKESIVSNTICNLIQLYGNCKCFCNWKPNWFNCHIWAHIVCAHLGYIPYVHMIMVVYHVKMVRDLIWCEDEMDSGLICILLYCFVWFAILCFQTWWRFGISERKWVEAQVENAKEQAILMTIRSQLKSDGAHIRLDLQSLRFVMPSNLFHSLLFILWSGLYYV